MNWASINGNWETGKLLYAEHHVFLEILWISATYLRFLVPSWRNITTPKHAKYAKLPWVPLISHVVAGTIELFRYYSQLAVTGESPEPNVVDLGLCLVMAASSFQLAAHVHEGNIPFVRTTFQGAAVQRVLASTLGFLHGDARWHRASIKLLNNFTWTRWIGVYAGYFQGFRAYADAFTASVVISHPLALWEGDYPAGIPLFGAVMFVLLVVDKWASRKLDGRPGFVPRVLAHCGLVTVKKGYFETASSGEKLE
ncbi:hypothetical protein ColTof4_05468 [Colletotrichum tofieldiae]|nr:hypothetical protein ColTof3_10277 [Colletotrichum tofieldiae]GKT73045.1 hypothetical protein ColTof4_05468 [Colletotrichum tofieldiae]GKT89103.1 hypothetical protein Ct61P_06953 [Colletotrichum tofieldiae]